MDYNEDKLEKLRELLRSDEDIVFGIKWFQKHQKKLLWFLNNRFTKIWFRWCLRIRKYDCPTKEKINSILPNNFTFAEKTVLIDFIVFKNGKKEILDLTKRTHKRLHKKCKIEKGFAIQKTTDFRTHDKYSKRLYFAFKPFWYLLHFFDWAMLDRVEALTQLSFGFSTLTQYPGSIGTNNPVDGVVRQQYTTGSGQSWATIIGAAGSGVSITDSYDDAIQVVADSTINNWRFNKRAIFCFDTSSLTSSASISATTFGLVGDGKTDTLSATPTIDVYLATPAATNTLAATDYANVGSTSQTGSPLTYSSWTTDSATYNTFTFNTYGGISKTGISSFCTRNANYDVAATAPTWGDGLTFRLDCEFSDVSGTTTDPKLVVTYTTVTAPTVTTQAVTDKTTTSGLGNGNITATGGANATRRGFCYLQGTSGDPTTADSVVYDDGDFGTGAFTKSITGLTAGTSYRIRAYAINSAGTSYGSTEDYKTTFDKAFTETITLVVSIKRLPSKIFKEITTLSATLAKQGIFVKSFIETITLVQTQIKDTSKSIKETLNLNLIFNTLSTFFRSFIETITLNEIFNVRMIYIKQFIETITTTDTYKNIGEKVLKETITLTDNITTLFTGFRSFVENITLTDTITKVKNAVRSFVENISLIDTYNNLTQKIISETISLTEIFTKQFTGFITLLETITLTDTIIKIKQAVRSFTETLTLTLTQTKIHSKSFIENIVLAITITTPKTARKSFTEIITLVQTLATVKTQYKILTETITLVATIKRTTTKVLKETLSLVQRFLGLFNGNDISYTKRYNSNETTNTARYTDNPTSNIKKYLDIPDE